MIDLYTLPMKLAGFKWKKPPPEQISFSQFIRFHEVHVRQFALAVKEGFIDLPVSTTADEAVAYQTALIDFIKSQPVSSNGTILS